MDLDSQLTITGAANGCPKPQYEFWALAPGSSTWQLVQAYSSSATAIWNNFSPVIGSYHISVWARDASSVGTAGDGLGRWDTYTTLSGPVF
jgi:hypothetical protein